MNDPGLDSTIDKVQQDEEADYSQLDGTAEQAERERDLLDKSRWWFASTACPLIAGTFGPLANAFNICAIGAYWRERVSSGLLIKDPPWLLAINSVSLACGFFANLALLFNMAGRAKFYIAQPVTIGGFFIASLLLIGLVSYCSHNSFREDPEEIILSQAYFYAAYAAGIYFLIASLNCFTVWGAIRGKYDKKFNLTTSQRTLMLQTISFVGYMLLGAAIFQSLEGWKFLDAVYWSSYTLLTIGTGPLYPTTHTARSLLIPYAIGGVFAVGLIIGSIRSLLLESGKAKMQARTTEKKRRRMFADNHAQKLLNRNRTTEKNVSDNGFESERQHRRREFEAMRSIKRRAYQENRYGSLAISTAATLALWLVGAAIFKYIEYEQEWSYFISIYFTYVQLTTIGYGDYTPGSNFGKVTFVFYVLLAVPTLTILISDMSDTVVKVVSKATNWVGALTILPSDRGVWSGLKSNMMKLKKGDLRGFRIKDTNGGSDEDDGRHGSVYDILRKRFEKEDLSSWTSDSYSGSIQKKNEQFYKWVLGKEVGKLIEDMSISPPKMYTYDEWAYYLKLLGQDESNPQHHIIPQKKPERNENRRPRVGVVMDDDFEVRPWSWLGLRSPLLSHREETDWILGHITSKLVRELGTSEPTEPPIKLEDI